jgi:replicative superfamily II helicase
MTQNFGRRLTPLGVAVRELTGDMQLSRAEVKNTQVYRQAQEDSLISLQLFIW